MLARDGADRSVVAAQLASANRFGSGRRRRPSSAALGGAVLLGVAAMACFHLVANAPERAIELPNRGLAAGGRHSARALAIRGPEASCACRTALLPSYPPFIALIPILFGLGVVRGRLGHLGRDLDPGARPDALGDRRARLAALRRRLPPAIGRRRGRDRPGGDAPQTGVGARMALPRPLAHRGGRAGCRPRRQAADAPGRRVAADHAPRQGGAGERGHRPRCCDREAGR